MTISEQLKGVSLSYGMKYFAPIDLYINSIYIYLFDLYIDSIFIYLCKPSNLKTRI